MENRTDHLVLALDFGGTKLAAAVVDLCAEKMVGPIIRRKTPVAEGAAGTLSAMIECGKEALAALPQPQSVKAIGISFGGPVREDRQNILRSNHVNNWDGSPLVKEISSAFDLPTFMDNDGNTAALGEWFFGGYRNLDNLIYFQVSTGVGGGLVLKKQLYRGSGLAGELGHYSVEMNGPQCSCGRNGCLESLSSGWAITRDGRNAMKINPEGCQTLVRLSQNRSEAVTAELVFEACRAGDPACEEIIKGALKALAMVTVNMITCTDPQVVVLGGGLTRSRDMFERYFLPVVQEQMHPFFVGRCRVEFSSLGGAEVLLGAALLTQEKE